MTPFVHDTAPQRVIFGPGCLDRVAGEVERLESARALVVATPGSGARLGARVAELLGGRSAGLHSEAVIHVPRAVAEKHAKRVLVCADAVSDDSLALLEAKIGRDRIHFVSEPEIRSYATNALPVGDTLLAASILPERVQRLLAKDGVKVELLEMKELCEKAGGASRCLVCQIRSLPDDFTIPDDARLAAFV